jgi:flagellar biosynthesis/type III secretory pathway M-ring protein FliF/YscJ
LTAGLTELERWKVVDREVEKRYAGLALGALGLPPDKADHVTIRAVPFPEPEPEPVPSAAARAFAFVAAWRWPIVLVGLVGIGALLARGRPRLVDERDVFKSVDEFEAVETGADETQKSVIGRRASDRQLVSRLDRIVRDDPRRAARIVEDWVREEV